jgi:hypothetical protein
LNVPQEASTVTINVCTALYVQDVIKSSAQDPVNFLSSASTEPVE